VEETDIEINKGYIHSWIQTALAAGSLDRTAPSDAVCDKETHWNCRTSAPTTAITTRSWIEAISLRMNSLNPKITDALQSATTTSSVMETPAPISPLNGSP
jgi:hypothetical protein